MYGGLLTLWQSCHSVQLAMSSTQLLCALLQGKTAIDYALEVHAIEIAKELLTHGADASSNIMVSSLIPGHACWWEQTVQLVLPPCLCSCLPKAHLTDAMSLQQCSAVFVVNGEALSPGCADLP